MLNLSIENLYIETLCLFVKCSLILQILYFGLSIFDYSANKYLLADHALRLKFAPLTGGIIDLFFFYGSTVSQPVATYGFLQSESFLWQRD